MLFFWEIKSTYPICRISPQLSLWDTIDSSGRVQGLNKELLTVLASLYSKQGLQRENATPYLSDFKVYKKPTNCSITSIYPNNTRDVYYASPSSGEAYRDRRLTTNFELWVEIFCVSTCFHVRIPKPCLSVRPSVCPHPEKRNPLSFVNISPTLVIDTSMERSSWVLHHGNPKIWIFFLKSLKFDFWRRAEITLASSISVLH